MRLSGHVVAPQEFCSEAFDVIVPSTKERNEGEVVEGWEGAGVASNALCWVVGGSRMYVVGFLCAFFFLFDDSSFHERNFRWPVLGFRMCLSQAFGLRGMLLRGLCSSMDPVLWGCSSHWSTPSL